MKKRNLFIIPARAGSKRIPNKNSNVFGDKPLIAHSIVFAQNNSDSKDEICISTNCHKIIKIANDYNISVPFIRPENLSNDLSSSFDVIKHAFEFYLKLNIEFENIILLQPTTPFRCNNDLMSMLKIHKIKNPEMTVSVEKIHHNTLKNLFYSESSKLNKVKIYDESQIKSENNLFKKNGSIYVINPNVMFRYNNLNLKNVMLYEMDKYHSIDIDYQNEWDFAEYLYIKNENNKNNS